MGQLTPVTKCPRRFIEDAAEESRYHAGHWFRYLRKIITDDNIQITPEEIDRIIEGDKLTLFSESQFKASCQKKYPYKQIHYWFESTNIDTNASGNHHEESTCLKRKKRHLKN